MFIILAYKALEISGGALWIEVCTYSTSSELKIHVQVMDMILVPRSHF